jgi:hypothetical protein
MNIQSGVCSSQDSVARLGALSHVPCIDSKHKNDTDMSKTKTKANAKHKRKQFKNAEPAAQIFEVILHEPRVATDRDIEPFIALQFAGESNAFHEHIALALLKQLQEFVGSLTIVDQAMSNTKSISGSIGYLSPPFFFKIHYKITLILPYDKADQYMKQGLQKQFEKTKDVFDAAPELGVLKKD